MSNEMRAIYEATLDDDTVNVSIRRLADDGTEPAYEVQFGDEAPFIVHALRPEQGVLSVLLDGRSWEAGLVALEDGFEVDVAGIPHEVEMIDPRRRALRTAGGGASASIKTQMPGRIVRIMVAEGDSVPKGQPMLVIEAMKMENEIKAPQDCVVNRLLVKEGDLVEARSVLVELG